MITAQIGDLVRWVGPVDLKDLSLQGIVTGVDSRDDSFWVMWLPSGDLGYYHQAHLAADDRVIEVACQT